MKSCDMETPGQTQTGSTMVTHLAYQPILPTVNKYLQQKWDTASYDLHRQRVESAKPIINTAPPKTYTHLSLKLKSQKEIQRENNMLLEKISHIMRTTGSVDNRNYYEKKSFGTKRRQLELLRITKENQRIQLRLSQCRSHYDLRSWHEDWLKTLKMMDMIARYPQGRANQQKGQENPSKKTAHIPASNKASGKAESEEKEKGKETSKKESTETKIQQEVTSPESNAPDKSTSPDTPESPGSSGAIQSTAEEPGDTAETCSSAETLEQETASPVVEG